MKPQLSLKAWLQENLARLFTKSPLFFRIWQLIGAAAVLLTSLPGWLSDIESAGIHIPQLLNDKANLIVKVAGYAIAGMAYLTTQSKPSAIDEKGNVLKQTNEGKLPFTAGAEQKLLTRELNKGSVKDVVSK